MKRDLTRKEFLKLSGAAAGAGLLASSGFGSLANAQTIDLLHRTIHSSGEMIPAVGLGTAETFGDLSQDFQMRRDTIETLFREGGTVIDTAPTYSKAEQVVGRALDELGARDKCFLATKTSTRGDKQVGIDQNTQSFIDLRTDKFDLLQVHNHRGTDMHIESINDLKADGKVRYVGLTHSNNSLNDAAVTVIESGRLDFMQVQYNMFDRSVEERVLPAARDNGVAMMINLPFARGRVFSATAGVEIPEWAKEFGVDSWGKFFLKYTIAHPDVTVAIPGTIHTHHVVDNIGALRGRLPTMIERARMVQFIEDL
ncbi:MAG: aldo/keto reductase [Kordiimonadaceae bacterium]|nr:aldo/keto reductase [Kordiimonadaceae bacterium]